MKRLFQKQQGLTIVEVLLVIATLFILADILLQSLAVTHRRSPRINCVSNLKQVNLAFRIWEGDNNNKYPMAIPVAEGGAKELIVTGGVASCLMVMSNELSTPKILICPMDTIHTCATNFGNDFNNSHISYFLGVDVTNESNPGMILTGDDNFTMNGVSIKSGVTQLPSNAPVSWGADRHQFVGNLGYADGRVAELSSAQLQEAFLQAGLATNRLAIP